MGMPVVVHGLSPKQQILKQAIDGNWSVPLCVQKHAVEQHNVQTRLITCIGESMPHTVGPPTVNLANWGAVARIDYFMTG
jgi:hypothetical protein